MRDRIKSWFTNRAPYSHRVWVAVIAVYIFLTVIAGVSMYLVSRDEQNADGYIDVLAIMLSWPVLAFSVVLIMILVFHSQIAEAFNNYYISRITRDGLHINQKPQKLPKNDDDFIPSDTQSSEVNIEAEYQYLTTVLTITTQDILRVLNDYSRPVDFDAFLKALRLIPSEIRTSISSYKEENTVQGVMLTGIDVVNSLEALIHFGLASKLDDFNYEITPKGNGFLEFLDSPGGIKVLRIRYLNYQKPQ